MIIRRKAIKNRGEICLAILLVSIVLLSCPQTLFAQGERVAVVSTFNGEVKIQHDGAWKSVTKVGSRIKNSSVYNGDTVLTMPGANVDLVFSDNTTLKIEEDTTLSISTRQITEQDRAKEGFVRNVSGTRQDIVRNINLKGGKLWASITPSKSVLTEFESPTGVAAVRGTKLTFSFLGGITGLDLIQGLLDFLTAINKLGLDFDSGDKLNISETADGKTKLDKASGEITLRTSEGVIQIGDGASLDLTIDPRTKRISVKSSTGKVTLTKPDGTKTPVKAGDELGATGGNGTDGTDADDSGDNNQTTNTDPFFGTSVSQTNDDLGEKEGPAKPITDPPGETPVTTITDVFGPNETASPAAIPLGANEIFTDNFSDGQLANWGGKNVAVGNGFGPIQAKDKDPNNKFAIMHKGSEAKLVKKFDFQVAGNRNIKFDFKVISPQNTIDSFDQFAAHLHTTANSASVMTFDSGSGTPHSYTEGDMTVTSNYSGGNGHIHLGNFGGDSTTDLMNHSGCCSEPYEFTNSNGTWDLTSFDVVSGGTTGNTFTSNLGHSKTIAGTGTTTLNWNGITTLTWDNNGTQTAIDNLTTNTNTINIPIPTGPLSPVTGLPTTGVPAGWLSSGGSGYQSEWIPVTWSDVVPAGEATFEFHLFGDIIVLIDNFFDPLVDLDDETTETPVSSTDYLLSFAKMIRDDDGIDADYIEDPDGIESDFASNINTDSDREVSLDAIRESLVVVKEFMENHVNDFGNTINHDKLKAQLDTLLAKVDASGKSGNSISSSLMTEIETVLSGIIADHDAHCKEDGVNCEFGNLHL